MDNGTINRALRLLSMLSDNSALSAKQAAIELGLPISTTHRLLRKLAEAEFASQAPKGGFSAGMELYRIAARLGGSMPFVRIAEPVLAELTERFEETSMLAILERHQLRMYFACSAAPAHPMRYVIELNKTMPLVWGASSRSLLAFLSEAEIQHAIDTADTPNVQGGKLDPAELREHLAQIRAQGFAVTHAHRSPDTVGLAAPFFSPNGEVLGCVALQLPEYRWPQDAISGLAEILKETAASISRKIGA